MISPRLGHAAVPLLCAALLPRAVAQEATPRPLWQFDHYLDFDEITAHVRDLARRRPDRVKLSSMGKSIQGRDLWLLTITNFASGTPESKPAVYLQGGIHGNEVSSVMVPLYIAWQLIGGERAATSRGTRRILERYTVYIAPAVNPDAVHHFVTEPNSHWRPRFNLRPHDADGDGKQDEDGYEDLDGDGEIGQMYRAAKAGRFVLVNGKLRLAQRGELKDLRYERIGREGRDDDGDGRYNEDGVGGINLNRNFPVGFRARKDFDGHRGAAAGSEPETKSIMSFVEKHENIALFLDYHNDTKSVLYWTGQDAPAADRTMYDTIARRAARALGGYALRPRDHAGAGLACAWAYGARGLPALLLELEPGRGQRDAYYAAKWRDGGWIKAKAFRHPQLGDILLGNDHKKLVRRNPHPSDITWQAQKHWKWLRAEVRKLPRLEISAPVFTPTETGWIAEGSITNLGEYPTDTAMASQRDRALPIRLLIDGADVTDSTTTLPPIAGGASRKFRLKLTKRAETVTLTARHPRAGSASVAICRPRSATRAPRSKYTVEAGFATPDRAIKADNEFFTKGAPKIERGPVFPLLHRKKNLRVAVLLGEFEDLEHRIPASEFEKRFFSLREYTGQTPVGTPAYGSVRDFYREMSYGKCDVEGQVFDWVKITGKYETYRKLRFGTRVFSKALKKAVLDKHGQDALDSFDMWVFIWAGNAVRRGYALWPVRMSRLKFGKNPLLPEGVIAFKTGEYHNGQMAPLGVLSHELGHTFGMNDKYGLWAPPQPLANWCLMASGEKGGEPSGRERPFHMCAWCKVVIGWVKPVAIDPAKRQKLALRPITKGPNECFRILLRPDGSEYLLLENRSRDGFHTDLPSPGLAVLHVGPPHERAKAYVKTVRLLPAHGKPAAARGKLAAVADVAWPGPNRTSFVVGTARISDIRLSDDVVYFEIGPSSK